MAERKDVFKGVIGSRREFALLIIAAVLMLIALGGFYYTQTSNSQEDQWVSMAHTLPSDAQQISAAAQNSRGLSPDFQLLSARIEDVNTAAHALAEGDKDLGIRPVPTLASREAGDVLAAWNEMKKVADQVVSADAPYKRVQLKIDEIVSAVHPEAGKGIYGQYESLGEQLAQSGGQTAFLVAQQMVRLDRIANDARRILSEGRNATANAQVVAGEIKEFIARNDQLMNVGATANVARQAHQSIEAASAAIDAIVKDVPQIEQMQLAAGDLQKHLTNVISTAATLEQRLIDTRVKQVILPIVVYVCGALAIVFMIAFVILSFVNFRSRLTEASERDTRQQQAILGLLDEITNLADGDLTVDVTVTEDFTGAIADSINYTVGNMRNLVGTINSTSTEIGAAANDTQQVTLKMSEASERQAKEITAVTNTVAATSQSLQQVAASAEKLAQQAQNSVLVAHNGAETVGRTIQGMAALREQIQDTSKRIKRLGESSQEIGNIIEFINDIAEQTNTLALNASIQAAMAGEQGRGFAVVADEVQRLAERAANATRQIENLVKTIQADTQEAITSMERSTTNVVTGAKSAEEAGQALTKVESSSQELARLIQEISLSARSQSAAATKIAGTMQVIREIAVQTSGSAGQTAQAVGELTTLSEKLRESVAGFKLP
ncbi:MAG: methyl-accepting chemotaxis protein [Nevskiaceae bacterium]|nr:MAG: methyl-accepting chemotaxis protein [Nevskiaceae bacterium]